MDKTVCGLEKGGGSGFTNGAVVRSVRCGQEVGSTEVLDGKEF
jgi:hypothetical protein